MLKQSRELRFGGDEFIIIFKNSSIEIAENIWLRITEAFDEINKLNKLNKKEYLLSASHGVCKYDRNKYSTIEEFIKCADTKMYEEKRRLKEIREKLS